MIMSRIISNREMTALCNEQERHCWVCFATEEEDPGQVWVRPCNCKGTSKWVHQRCLQRWVDEKQRGNPISQVACPQCNTFYVIVYPDMGPIVMILDTVHSIVYKVCPFLAAGMMVCSVYWVAVTYGAVTLMQVLGQDEGQIILERSEPLVLLIMLPTIPVALILGKMIQWEDTVLSFLRRNISKVPLVRHIFPSIACGADEQYPPPPQMTDPGSATRVLCSALVFPSVAVGVGNVFFRSVKSHAQRTALGAIAFLVFKGALNLYHKQQQYVRKRHRRILDYRTDDVSPSSVVAPSSST